MCSLRLEVEQATGLKFPVKNGEALIQFEESMEIPRSAETLMKGMYRNPDDVKRNFQALHQETANFLELLLPRRSRLREWGDELPKQPKEAENFIKDTSEQLHRQQQRLVKVEKDLLTQLEEGGLQDIFPLSVSAFAQIDQNEPSVKLYLRPLGRLAEILQLNPEHLRQVVRLHYLVMLLLMAGQDFDGQVCKRKNEEKVLTLLTCFYTLRLIRGQSQEKVHCYTEWVGSWEGKGVLQALSQETSVEKVRAAMVFWRRRMNVSWDEVWERVNLLDADTVTERNDRERKFYN